MMDYFEARDRLMECRRCGDCANFEPRWTTGFAAHGRIYKSKLREGECTRYGLVVAENNLTDDDCWEGK